MGARVRVSATLRQVRLLTEQQSDFLPRMRCGGPTGEQQKRSTTLSNRWDTPAVALKALSTHRTSIVIATIDSQTSSEQPSQSW